MLPFFFSFSFLTHCYCWSEHWMCEGSGECGLAGSMMAISAALCFECNLPPGSAGNLCVWWASYSLCGDQRDPQNSQRTEEVTQSDPTQLSQVNWSLLIPLRTQQTGPVGTRLSRAVHHVSFSVHSVDGFVWALTRGRLCYRLWRTWCPDDPVCHSTVHLR